MVNPLPAPQAFRNAALLESNWDDEYGSLRLLIRDIQSQADFSLHKS
jgi:hypothetical protein